MGLRKPKSINHNGRALVQILEAHERFFSGKGGGAIQVRANFPGAREPVFFQMPRLDISSSLIRDRVAAGRSIRYLVRDRVAARIARERLYR